MLERINQELKRRTHVIRIFPNEESCLRLIRALAVEPELSPLIAENGVIQQSDAGPRPKL